MTQLYLRFGGLVVMLLLSMVYESNCCFITNCPPGGKRSLMPSLNVNSKECTRCGPALSGRCYGSNICCSTLFGCSVGGPITNRCALEAYNPQPCHNPGPSCGSNGKGICALNSTCCTAEGCFIDKSCSSASESMEFTL